MKLLDVINLGLCDYSVAYEKQKEMVDARKQDLISDTLMFVEHPTVYTYGRKTDKMPPNVPGIEVERGGEVTLHNPGQMVCYPILQLGETERDIALYLRRLEQVIIDCLRCFEITADRREGATGVWVQGGQKKIASIGVAVSSWVTYHGIALNVHNDLRPFQLIQPCGFSPEVMTSVEKERWPDFCPDLKPLQDQFVRCFSNIFHRRTKSIPGLVLPKHESLWRLSV